MKSGFFNQFPRQLVQLTERSGIYDVDTVDWGSRTLSFCSRNLHSLQRSALSLAGRLKFLPHGVSTSSYYKNQML